MRNHLNRVHKKNVNNVQDETSIKHQSSLIVWQKSKCALGQGKYASKIDLLETNVVRWYPYRMCYIHAPCIAS